MGALSFSETINRLSEYRHKNRECVEGDNTIKIDCQTFAYTEYWLRYAYETGHLAEIVRCKDCKHGKINICDEFTTCYNEYSCLYGNTRKSNWFCADGEKAVSE